MLQSCIEWSCWRTCKVLLILTMPVRTESSHGPCRTWCIAHDALHLIASGNSVVCVSCIVLTEDTGRTIPQKLTCKRYRLLPISRPGPPKQRVELVIKQSDEIRQMFWVGRRVLLGVFRRKSSWNVARPPHRGPSCSRSRGTDSYRSW